ncbi:MAG: hypothetical protein ACI82A_001293 [Candidatus Azotimanducaceae bacterium]|jgi:hypothetical protein
MKIVLLATFNLVTHGYMSPSFGLTESKGSLIAAQYYPKSLSPEFESQVRVVID